jgi:hypothetical protein
MSAFLAGLCLSAAPANAACTPDPASSGQTVTCSDTPGGFQAGGGVDSLTVNVLPGATVSDGGGGVVIGVNDFNTVTNSGTLTAGPNRSRSATRPGWRRSPSLRSMTTTPSATSPAQPSPSASTPSAS